MAAIKYLMDGGKSDAFNLGNGRGFSVREIIETVKNITGKDFPVVETERRPGDPPRLIGSSEKANKILGWKPEFHDINTIIETAWKWHQKLQDLM